MLWREPPIRVAETDRRLRRLLIGGLAVLVALGTFPFWGGALAARLGQDALAERLGMSVRIGKGRAGLTTLTLQGIRLAEPGRTPLAEVERIRIPYAAAWGKGHVLVDGLKLEIERGGPTDNTRALLARLGVRSSKSKEKPATGAAPSSPRVAAVTVRSGSLRARDAQLGAALVVESLRIELWPGRELIVQAGVSAGMVRLRGRDSDPRFGASDLKIRVPLRGLRPLPLPAVDITGGYLEPLPELGLTGIAGTIRPAPVAGQPVDSMQPLVVALRGSYGGARESLWRATGEVKVPLAGEGMELAINVRAARFSLDRIREVLPPSILRPADTNLDAALDLRYAGGKLGFSGNLDVSGLNLQHEAVSSSPVQGLNLALVLDGTLDPSRRRLELTRFEGRMRELTGTLSGAVELTPGRFKFTDGSEMPMVPKIEISLKVPRIGCAKLLESIPAPVIPHLQGFVLQGMFEANVFTKIDYANLDAIELGGKVAIDGCRVVQAPNAVRALGGPGSITQIVEIPSADRNAPPGATELMAFAIGPENPDFVTYDRLSPYLIGSIMTTEDSSFFRHRGWVSPEFKTALRRNLAGGGFRLGASSITMQMVKNVLLSREKTLSRKLQELFVVWFIEKLLPKERILELYFNAIEFGPRLYGIGAAARHYFGKHPSELTPLQAAFFSSILPSPKRRYIQYCHGQLLPAWDRYVRRILARVYERGRLTEDEYTTAATQPLEFDLTNRTMSASECMAWVKKITFRAPQIEPPTEADN
jgi:hypothetical protein